METIKTNNYCHFKEVIYSVNDINMVIYGINFNQKKQLTFIRNSNFMIMGSLHDTLSKDNSLELRITNESPFYQPLANFIGDQESAIIEDDLIDSDKRIVLTKMDNEIVIECIHLGSKASLDFQIMIINDNSASKSTLITRLYVLFHELSVVFKMYDRGFSLIHQIMNSTF